MGTVTPTAGVSSSRYKAACQLQQQCHPQGQQLTTAVLQDTCAPSAAAVAAATLRGSHISSRDAVVIMANRMGCLILWSHLRQSTMLQFGRRCK